MYPRLCNPLITNSFFLFGARSTGKSSLLKTLFAGSEHIWIDLLDDENFITLSRTPKVLQERIEERLRVTPNGHIFVILDEIQRVPKLLNEVHRLIEHAPFKNKILFALTGSSARKLKHGSANLLGGRALINNLFPLTSLELGKDFELSEILQFGSLPHIYVEKNLTVKKELLRSYVGTYLREEIREEQIVRNLDPFLRFLEVAAQSSGKIINHASIGRDCQVDSKTVARYFQILEETLLGVSIPAHHESVRKQQRQNPKFYLFDIGVQRALRSMLDIPVVEQSYEFGTLFEHFIVLEIHRLNSYYRKNYSLSYIRTKDGAEIDLILQKPGDKIFLIEIKSSTNVSDIEVRKLARFKDDFNDVEILILSREEHARRVEEVSVLPWMEGLRRIFDSHAT